MSDIIYLDREAVLRSFDLIPEGKIVTSRSAYLKLLIEGPIRIHGTALRTIVRRWRLARTAAAKILRRLFNAGLVNIADGFLVAVAFSDAKPSAFLEEGGSWRILRQKVFERDGFACTYCGDAGGVLHADHIVPRVRGGADEMSNLTTACARCNLSKGSKSLEDWKS